MKLPELTLVPTEDLATELHRRSFSLLMWVCEKEADTKTNMHSFLSKGEPKLIGDIHASLFYDISKLILDSTDDDFDKGREYVNAFLDKFEEVRDDVFELFLGRSDQADVS